MRKSACAFAVSCDDPAEVTPGEGAPTGKLQSYALACSAGFRFTRLIVPEK